MNIKDFSTNLLKVYEEMSDHFSSYQSSTGWNCLSSCGRCCVNPDIEASLYEMIPMAFQIYLDGELQKWLTNLEDSEQEQCLLLNSEGRCVRYQERPAVCRMFGVAGYKNKKEQITLSICKYIKEEYKITEAPVGLNRNDTPMIVDWTYRLSTLDQKLIQEKLPINVALKKALEKVALCAQYHEATSET